MAKGGGDAPSPDPLIGVSALKQAQTGEKWLKYATDQAAIANKRQKGVDKIANQVTQTQLGVMRDQAQWGREDRQRYVSKIRPVEDQYIAEAQAAGTEAKQNEMAAQAAADVQGGAADARGTANREAAAVGITPGSGRYAGIQRAGELGTGLALAGGKNTARAGERARGLALKGDVINMGRGLPAQAAAGAAGAVGAGSAAFGTAGGNQQLSMMPAQLGMQGFGGAMQGWAGAGNTMSNLYGLQLQKYQIDQESKSAGISGIANAIGTVAGMAWASSPKVKKNVKGMKKGAGMKALKKTAIKKFTYKPGHGDGGDHIGPMSDSFSASIGKKDSGMIHAQDAIGITMAAVKDLDAKVDKLGKKVGLKGQKDPTPRRKSQSPAKARKSQPGKLGKPPKGKGMLRGPDIKPVRAAGIGISRRA